MAKPQNRGSGTLGSNLRAPGPKNLKKCQNFIVSFPSGDNQIDH